MLEKKDACREMVICRIPKNKRLDSIWWLVSFVLLELDSFQTMVLQSFLLRKYVPVLWLVLFKICADNRDHLGSA